MEEEKRGGIKRHGVRYCKSGRLSKQVWLVNRNRKQGKWFLFLARSKIKWDEDRKEAIKSVTVCGGTTNDRWAISRRFSHISKSDIYNLLSAHTTGKLSWQSAVHQKEIWRGGPGRQSKWSPLPSMPCIYLLPDDSFCKIHYISLSYWHWKSRPVCLPRE